MSSKSLLKSNQYDINEKLSILIPTVGQILEDEQNYYSIITSIISTPWDMKVQLDDAGIDYETITDYELFLNMFEGLKSADTSLVFGDLNLSKFKLAVNNENGETVLYNEDEDAVIDRLIHMRICDAIREIHLFEPNRYHAGNSSAKKFIIDMERKKQKRRAKKKYKPYLDGLIVSLVNYNGFKYNFETVMDLSIYNFNMSLKAIRKYLNYEQLMAGYFFGTVDITKVSEESLNWISL